MKISTCQVMKLTITDVPDLDPISVMVENLGPGAGKITITCFGDAWSNYWGFMGQHTLESFFCKCDEHYLAGKLKIGIQSRVADENDDELERLLKNEIIKQRSRCWLTKETARDLWDRATAAFYGDHADVCFEVLGNEWWDFLPKRANPDYEYLCLIIKTVQTAFKQQKEQQAC